MTRDYRCRTVCGTDCPDCHPALQEQGDDLTVYDLAERVVAGHPVSSEGHKEVARELLRISALEKQPALEEQPPALEEQLPIITLTRDCRVRPNGYKLYVDGMFSIWNKGAR